MILISRVGGYPISAGYNILSSAVADERVGANTFDLRPHLARTATCTQITPVITM